MRLIYALSIVFVLGVTSPARADETFPVYQPKVVPPCTVYVIPGVGTVCGFVDVEDWKAILEADAELASKRELLAKEKERSVNLAQQAELLQGQVDTCKKSQGALDERNRKLTKDLIDLDLKYQNERVKPRWGSFLSWTIAAVSTSILAGVLLKSRFD
jgi:hypothetical protein